MKKIMLIYPTGENFQRSEDRCQIDVKASVANSLRACNDLGYVSSILKKQNYTVFLRDYQVEQLSFADFENDFKAFLPDVVFISITNGSIYKDLEFVSKIKQLKQDVVIILKGALFFNPNGDLFKELDLTNVDLLIGGEVEFIISDLLDSYFYHQENLSNIQGISYKLNNVWHTNYLYEFNWDLDKVPFPDRSLMKNELYLNPATNNPMATISTSRGCPSSCIYCMSPIISGKKIRFRTPKNVIDELKQCYFDYNIKDFFFKSDTFTISRQWVIDICDLIIESELNGKINWVANSRVNTVDEEMLLKMKQAGCSLIALGLESGSSESLKLMQKGTTIEQNKKTVELIKKVGLKTFGFYLIGFPWESKKHLKETKKLIFKLDTDFIEISIATPFKGTKLHDIVFESDVKDNVLGKDSFKNVTVGTKYLTVKQLEKFRKSVLLQYHLRASYIFKKLFNKQLTFDVFKNYVKYGLRLLKNTIR